MGVLPYLRLVGADPVGFRLSLKIGDRVGNPYNFEQKPPCAADRGQAKGLTLIQPQDSRPKRFSGSVHIDDRAPLGGERYTGDCVLFHMLALP